MKHTILRSVKNFSEIMDSINLDNIKPLKAISEMSQNELQSQLDHIMQYEIPCILELINNTKNEKEIKFYQEKLIATQTRYAEYHLQHLKNFVNRKY